MCTWTTARSPVTRLSQHCSPSGEATMAKGQTDIPRASKTWPDLSVPSGRDRVTISLNLGNLTYRHPLSATTIAILGRGTKRTFSRMTSGPLTPPTVLYRILGTTEYGSRGSAMMQTTQPGPQEKTRDGDSSSCPTGSRERERESEEAKRRAVRAEAERGWMPRF